MKISVFDSGMGGLIISQELQKAFPQEEFVFVADSINFPYGTKSDEELQVAIADRTDVGGYHHCRLQHRLFHY